MYPYLLLHISSLIPKISSLCCEIAHLRQTIDPAEQKLKLPVGRSWSILGYHVTRQIDRHKGQPSFRVRCSENASPCQRTVAEFAMVGHEEGVRRRGLETLRAIPCHVLDHEQRAWISLKCMILSR